MNLNLNKQKNKKGFAMLFAVLTSSLLISIGISIFSISLKELMISASIRDSQSAYYAGESAYECFKYWNIFSGTGAFNPTIQGTSTLKTGNDLTTTIKCNNIPLNIVLDEENIFHHGNNTYSYSSSTGVFFKYSGSDDTKPEARFSFEIGAKYDCEYDPAFCVTPYIINSTSTFSGYNTGVSGRRVERSYQIIE